MTILAPMRTEAYASYMQSFAANFAEGNIKAGYWHQEGALERSLAVFEKLLPQGLVTPNNYLFEIVGNEGSQMVGSVWFSVQEQLGIRDAWVSYIEVKPEFRRQGYATRAFQALEAIVVPLGVSSIGLHVFNHNREAQAFYSQLGFVIPGVNMIKQVGERIAHGLG